LAAKGAQRQVPLPAELDPAQPAGFVNQLLDLGLAARCRTTQHLFFILSCSYFIINSFAGTDGLA
jgi:hypothetical protein